MNTAKSIIMLALISTFLSCGKEEEEIIQLIEEEIEESLEEKYSGTWSSTLSTKTYDKIPVSLKITPEEGTNNWTGEFFFTAGYTACCDGGANNGTLTLTIEGNEITSFKYDDTIPNCNGTFEGNGQKDGNTLNISFAGSDCEGEHKDGIMTLTKGS